MENNAPGLFCIRHHASILTLLDFQARGRMSLDLGSKTRIKILAKVVKLVKLDMPKAQAKDQTNRKRLNTS